MVLTSMNLSWKIIKFYNVYFSGINVLAHKYTLTLQAWWLCELIKFQIVYSFLF